MKANIVFGLSAFGVLAGLYSAYVSSQRPPAQPPAFNPASNPYDKGVFANGIIESAQTHGSNINIYPEVSGPLTRVCVNEGDKVRRGDPLLTIDDSVQRAIVQQQQAQAQAAKTLLDELRAQPRPEVLEVTRAQLANAHANLKNAQDHLAKLEVAAQSITLDDLDNARNAVSVASTNAAVVQAQYDLLKAGAWSYDIGNQQMQYDALSKAAAASDALLAKYTLKAPCDGVVLSIQTAAGSYVSPQGAYGTYTQGFSPLIVMSAPQDFLEVRCYVDEILISKLPPADRMGAKMSVRGTNLTIPLTFERMQPYVSPKVELADQRQERVDVRVLPVIFRFARPASIDLNPANWWTSTLAPGESWGAGSRSQLRAQPFFEAAWREPAILSGRHDGAP